MGGPRLVIPRVEVGIDCADPEALAPFWLVALGYARARGNGDPFIDLLPDDPGRPVVFLQRTRDPKRGKNRVHLDLYVPEPVALAERLVALGASRLGEPRGEGAEWFQVMADPEGNEFCVCAERPP
jgi:glyoxalase superfamily protein